jgi:hypothetical protein
MLDFLRSRQWIIARRLFLVALVVIIAIRQYGGSVVTYLRRPDPTRDIEITHAEFRPNLTGSKPSWIIFFHNASKKFTYDQIQLEATYMDDAGNVLEKDKLIVRQKLLPGDDKQLASFDFKARGSARTGTLRVLGAQDIK